MVLTEIVHFESIYGQPLTLSTIHHENCLEYVLEKPLVPVYKLGNFHLACTFFCTTIFSFFLGKYVLMAVSICGLLYFSLKIPWEVQKGNFLAKKIC